MKSARLFCAAVGLAGLMAALLSAALPAPVCAYLADNTNYALGRGNMTYITVMVPADWKGDVLKKTLFEVRTNCAWCDVQGDTRIMTDAANPVVLPILVTASGMKGDSQSFYVEVAAEEKSRRYNYGVCVSDREDVDIGEGRPCEVVSRLQNVFSMQVQPAVVHARPASDVPLTLYLQSEGALDVRLTTSFGGGRSVTLSPNQPETIEMLVESPEEPGEYELTVDAKAAGCDLESCTVSVPLTLFVEENPAPDSGRSDFDVSIFPDNYDIEGPGTINYILRIDNYGPGKEMTAKVSVDDGLSTDFSTVKKTVSGTESMRFTVTVEEGGKQFHKIKAVVETENISREAEASLSVNEMSSDLDRMGSVLNLTRDTKSDVNMWKIEHADQGMDRNLNSFNSLMSTVKGEQEQGGRNSTLPPWVQPDDEAPQDSGSWLVFVIIPVIIGAAVGGIWFYSRGRVVSGETQAGGFQD
jgi:hypothetical protein